ncbi:hypothetical protein [Streptomyces sp. NPDC127066]|uniref:hypothetical protein n=1 Tax=Streptomyces sp. NPDC127066 TaxID=3347125 RepID=UPI003662D96D
MQRVPAATDRQRAGAADIAVRLTLSHMLLPSADRDCVPHEVAQAVLAVLGSDAG